MTFRVFFCAGVCALLLPVGRFGTNAAGLSCPDDFFGAGAAWSSLTFPALFLRCFFGTDLSGAVCLLLHCSWESLCSRHCLGSLIFSTLSTGISLEQTLAGTVRPFPHYSPGVSLERALAEIACPYRTIPGHFFGTGTGRGSLFSPILPTAAYSPA